MIVILWSKLDFRIEVINMKGNQSPQNQHPYPQKFTFPKTTGRLVEIKNLQIDRGIGNKWQGE